MGCNADDVHSLVGCDGFVWDRSPCGGREGRRVCVAWRPPFGCFEGRPLGCPGRGKDRSFCASGPALMANKLLSDGADEICNIKLTCSSFSQLNLASQSVLEGLNACFDHRAEIFIPELGMSFQVQQEKTKIFGCQNPFTQGGGRKGLPKSFLNRFTQVRNS